MKKKWQIIAEAILAALAALLGALSGTQINL